MRSIAQISASIALAGAAHAAQFQFTIDSAQSAVASSTSFETPFAGSFVGDFDKTANPAGTQTRPGAFGGSGNQPIPYTASGEASGESSTNPAGSFALNIDTGALTVEMSGLTADLLAGAAPAFGLTLNVQYSTFHTVSPTALFLGGPVIPIPLGEATLTTLALAQDAPASGVLTPDGLGGYTFTILAQATITIEATLIGGQPFAPAPASLPVAITGTVTISGASATATIAADLAAAQTIPGPFPGGAFADLPLAVPTILPPGSTANLLFSGEIESFGFEFATSIDLVADGVAPCVGDTNGDGVVNFADLNIVLGAFGLSAGQPGFVPGADLNGDGAVNFADLNIVLSNFGAVC